GQALHVTPGLIAVGRRAPRTAVALDGAERCLGTQPLVPLDQLADVDLLELTSEVAQAARIARVIAWDGRRWRGPEDLLERARLEPDDGAVRQQRVHEHAVTADRVDAQNHREARRAFAPDERQPPGLGLDHATLMSAGAAP